MRRALIALTILAVGPLAGCLHRAGPGIPANAAVAVVAFDNHTHIAALGPGLTAAVVSELTARTRYRVGTTPAGARATVHADILSMGLVANVADAERQTGTVEVTLRLRVWMVRADGREMFRDDNLVFQDRPAFDAGAASDAFFAEDSTAFPAICRRAAAEIVTQLLAGLKR